MLASLRGTLLRKGHSCRADSFPSKEACKVFSQTCECLWSNHEQGTTNPLQINKRKGSDFSLVDVCISVSQLNSVTSKHTCLGPRRQTEAWEFALTRGPGDSVCPLTMLSNERERAALILHTLARSNGPRMLVSWDPCPQTSGWSPEDNNGDPSGNSLRGCSQTNRMWVEGDRVSGRKGVE